MDVIPAIDIRGGRCVRLAQGDYARETVFDDDPLAVAQRWVAQGATRLHVVDLDGAREGRQVNADAIEAIARVVPCPVQTGGGIRDLAAIRRALDAGLDRVVLGTAAVKNPGLLREAVGLAGDRLVVSVDARDGIVRLEGWTETTNLDAGGWISQLTAIGVQRIVYTDISRDGVAGSPNFGMYEWLLASTRLAVIAAGGISSVDDIRRLRAAGVEGAIVGRALYTGDVDLAAALTAAA